MSAAAGDARERVADALTVVSAFEQIPPQDAADGGQLLAAAVVLRDEVQRLTDRVAELENEAFKPLPWADLMDSEDLAEFLADLAGVNLDRFDDAQSLTALRRVLSTWQGIAVAQHTHNSTPPEVAGVEACSAVSLVGGHACEVRGGHGLHRYTSPLDGAQHTWISPPRAGGAS